MAATIHPSSIVHPTARIADGAIIGPFCLIGPEVTIGEGTELRSHVVIDCHTTLGRENVVFQFTTLGGVPQDRKFRGEITTCAIGDRNQIRENVTIHRGTQNGGGATRVGNGNLLMAGAHVAHDCVVGNLVTIANEAMLAGHVHVHDGASIAGGAGVHHFVTVGTLAFVGGLARVERDVPPYMILQGSPAEVRGPNVIGMQRHGWSAEDVDSMRTAYKRLFGPRSERGTLSFPERVEHLRLEFPEARCVVELCDAMQRSAGGVKGRANERVRHDDKRSVLPGVGGVARVRLDSA